MDSAQWHRVWLRDKGTCQSCFLKEEESNRNHVRARNVHKKTLEGLKDDELIILCNVCTLKRIHKARSLDKRDQTLKNLDALRQSSIPTIGDTMKGGGNGRDSTKPRRKKK